MVGSLSLNNVSAGYGRKVVVSGVSISFKPGEVVCLLGRNGMGKSTLLRTIAGFQPPLAGDITIGDKTLASFDRKQLSQVIGIVLTEHGDIPDLSVREIVALGRSPHTGFFGNLSPDDNSIVDEAMTRVGIKHLEARNIATLSDGERQKAMIAKALAQQTSIILLDEPTAFLDYPSRVELFQLLRQLAQEEQKIILMTTHDLQLARQYASRLWPLDDILRYIE